MNNSWNQSTQTREQLAAFGQGAKAPDGCAEERPTLIRTGGTLYLVTLDGKMHRVIDRGALPPHHIGISV